MRVQVAAEATYPLDSQKGGTTAGDFGTSALPMLAAAVLTKCATVVYRYRFWSWPPA